MNHTYRLVWNSNTQCRVPASEHARSRGRQGGGKAAKLIAAALLAGIGGTGHALPTDGQVTAGQGSVSTSGNTMTVNQQSGKLAMDWRSFGIAAGETVRFVQPSASAIALNRVIGSDPSAIYGNLQANGQVFLINPNGILFAPGAQVNVGGLVASTLDLSNADFLAGKYQFSSSGATPAGVVNQGSITASPGGYVALLGGTASNQGLIAARLGTVALAAGAGVTLNFDGNQLLNVKVDQAALGALAENRQLIQADGGLVVMTAAARDALLATVVNNTGLIQARSVQNQGGVIKLLGDTAGGAVLVGGTLDASAPAALNPDGGNGGAVETSGAHVQIAEDAVVKVGADRGRAGTWLLDPTDITINAAAAGTIAGTLNGGGNVTQSTTSGGTDAGDITVASGITWTGTGTLTLNADRNIAINAPISGVNGGLTLAAGNNISAPAPVNVGTFTLQSGNWSQTGASLPAFAANDFQLQGGSFLRALGGGGTPASPYLLADVYGLQGMASSSLLGASFSLANDINASGTANWNGGAGFKPVGDGSTSYTGSFNGNGHAVSNLKIDLASNDYVGLFGYVGSGGAVSNVTLTGGSVNGASYVGMLAGQNDGSISGAQSSGAANSSSGSFTGGLVGYNTGSISNASSSGTVTGSSSTGGLIGYNNGGTLTSVSASGAVSGAFSTGGLVGVNTGSLATGNASGAVTGSFSTGGLIGENQGNVSNAYATGNIQGDATTGGLVGYNSGTLIDVHATGGVTATSASSGGLVGKSTGSITRAWATGAVSGYTQVGGLVGTNDGGITVSYASGAVTGSSNEIGGFVGHNNGSISDVYATGAVTGVDWVGGMFGINDSSASITRAYSTGHVTSTGNPAVAVHVGGFGGSKLGTLTDGFWDRNTSGFTRGIGFNNSGATGLTTAQAMTQTRYTHFDFTNTWAIYSGQTYPLLRAFLTPLTVSAANASKTYDGIAYSGGNGLSLPAGADPALVLGTPVYGGNSQGAKNAGNYALSVSGLYSTQQGYLISYANGALTINPKTITVNASAADRVYDGTTAASVSLASAGVVAGDTLSFASTGANFDNKNAGTGKTVTVTGISAAGASVGNYQLAGTSATTTASITPKAVTVSASGVDKAYDGTTAASVTLGSSGLITGDTVSFTGSASFDTKNVGTGKAVSVTGISAGGADAGNYSLSNSGAATSASITPKAITVAASGVDKAYDGTTGASVTLGSGGLIAGDTVSFGYTGASFADKNAGNAKAVSVAGISAAGTDAGNYIVSNSGAGTTANITPKAITVTATGVDKGYDGGTAASVGIASSGLIAGDTVSFTRSGASFADKNVGTGKAVTVTGIAAAGTDGGNYSVSNTGATTSASITPAALTISGITAADKAYDGTTGATVSTAGVVASGLIAGDNVSVAASGRFGDKNAGNGKVVNLSSSYGGADVGNYSITGQASTTASITPKAITVAATGIDKVYDGTTGATVTLGSGGLIAGDAVSFSNSGASFADRNVGNAKLVSVAGIAAAGADAGNYSVSNGSASTTASITPATLTYTANQASRTAGQVPTGLSGQVSGFVAGDNLANSTSGALRWDTPAGAASPVGQYAIRGAGLTANQGNYNFQQAAANATALTLTPAPLPATGSGSGSGSGSGTAASTGAQQAAGQVLASVTGTNPAGSDPGAGPITTPIADGGTQGNNVFSAPPLPCASSGAAPNQATAERGRAAGSDDPSADASAAPCAKQGRAPGALLRLIDGGIRLPPGVAPSVGADD